MKKLSLLAFFAAALVFIPLSAQAQPACYPPYCDWMINGDFSSTTGWTRHTGTSFPSPNDPCLSGSPANKLAELQNGEWLLSPSMYIDSNWSGGTHFEVSFNLYLLDDTENWYDQLKVIVKNLDTNATETFYVHGDTYNTSCTAKLFTLSSNYLNHNVSVRFEVASLATGRYQIDNVSFWSH